jgi:hypothetical protein
LSSPSSYGPSASDNRLVTGLPIVLAVDGRAVAVRAEGGRR